MGILRWLVENWFTLLNSIGIVGGLFFTAFSLHSETKTRRVANLLTLTQNHREIWKEFYRRPNLARVLEPNPNLTRQPVTRDEEIFVILVIQHLNSVYQTMHHQLAITPDGLRRDVWQFFDLPIPRAVWERIKVLQDDAFVRFVEGCVNWK